MEPQVLYLLAADVMRLVHFLFVAFVTLGLLAILAGRVFSWSWVRNPWFRVAHLVVIGLVVFQSWLGLICPLTTWEMALRERAGDATYSGSFIVHWLEHLLYYSAPDWVFITGYTTFACLVLVTWYWVPPRPFTR